MYKKSMSEALQEAREYRDPTLDEIVGGRGEMTISKDDQVLIIKTKDWQTFKAKGWQKREEVEKENLDLPATGAITSNSTGQEDEVEESAIMGLNKSSAEYKAGKEAAKKGIKYDDNPHAPGVKRLNWSTGHNDFRADNLRKAGKPNYGARGQFEEVEGEELDEVHFSNRGEPPAPKGMHKLRSGRDIPSTPQVDKIHKKVMAMTDRNDHFGATIQLAKECGDKDLVQIYNALELMHRKYGVVGNKSIELRQIFSPVLNKLLDRKFGKYADVLRDAL